MSKKTSLVKCDYCGKDLLSPPSGLVVHMRKKDGKGRMPIVYFACKNGCDDALKSKYGKRNYGFGMLHEISHLTNPFFYRDYVLQLIENGSLPKRVREKELILLRAFAPRVFRRGNSEERKHADMRYSGEA